MAPRRACRGPPAVQRQGGGSTAVRLHRALQEDVHSGWEDGGATAVVVVGPQRCSPSGAGRSIDATTTPEGGDARRRIWLTAAGPARRQWGPWALLLHAGAGSSALRCAMPRRGGIAAAAVASLLCLAMSAGERPCLTVAVAPVLKEGTATDEPGSRQLPGRCVPGRRVHGPHHHGGRLDGRVDGPWVDEGPGLCVCVCVCQVV